MRESFASSLGNPERSETYVVCLAPKFWLQDWTLLHHTLDLGGDFVTLELRLRFRLTLSRNIDARAATSPDGCGSLSIDALCAVTGRV